MLSNLTVFLTLTLPQIITITQTLTLTLTYSFLHKEKLERLSQESANISELYNRPKETILSVNSRLGDLDNNLNNNLDPWIKSKNKVGIMSEADGYNHVNNDVNNDVKKKFYDSYESTESYGDNDNVINVNRGVMLTGGWSTMDSQALR
jgi:hypothetical protein